MDTWKRTLLKLRLVSGTICLSMMLCLIGLSLYISSLLVGGRVIYYVGWGTMIVMMISLVPLVRLYTVYWYRLYDEVKGNPNPEAKSWFEHMESERGRI